MHIKTMLEVLHPCAEAITDRFHGWTLIVSDKPGMMLGDNPIIKLGLPPQNVKLPKDVAWFKSRGSGYNAADHIILPLGRDRWLRLSPEHSNRIEHCGEAEVDAINKQMAKQAWESIYCHPDNSSTLSNIEFDLPYPPIVDLTGPSDFKVGVDGIGGSTDRHKPIPHKTVDEWDWNGGSIDD